MAKQARPDHDGEHRAQYDKNKRKIILTQDICGICGKPVDKNLKWPNPLSPTVDHIIPISKGGHPSALDNLQLAHMTCNRLKSDKIYAENAVLKDSRVVSNRILPQSINWAQYRAN